MRSLEVKDVFENFRFETFVDVHSNIFEEYLSSVIAKLPKEDVYKRQDMDSFLEKQTCQIPEFDNDLVRRLIANIKVVSAEKLIIQFQAGIVMEQEIRYE